jgi:hypothetical protein
MKNLKQYYLIAILAVLSVACSNDNTANDPALLSFKFEGVSTSISNGRVASQLEITEAQIGVTKIEFELEHEDEHHNSSSNDDDKQSGNDDNKSDDSEFELELKGNWVVDLLDGTSNPDLPVMSIDPGQFNELKIVLSPIIDGKYSVVYKANLTDDLGNQVPVEILLTSEIIFKVYDDAGFVVSSEKLNEIIVKLELDKWLSGIDLSSLNVENGKIKISIDHNEGEIEKIKINIKDHCGSGSDDD